MKNIHPVNCLHQPAKNIRANVAKIALGIVGKIKGCNKKKDSLRESPAKSHGRLKFGGHWIEFTG